MRAAILHLPLNHVGPLLWQLLSVCLQQKKQ
jgi:hypothetical protein